MRYAAIRSRSSRSTSPVSVHIVSVRAERELYAIRPHNVDYNSDRILRSGTCVHLACSSKTKAALASIIENASRVSR